jgi:hypothetical protein
MSTLRKLATLGIGVLAVMATDICSSVPLCAQAPAGSPATTASPVGPGVGGMGRMPADPKALSAPRTIAPYFMRATSVPKAPDADGFLRRWMLLEPINKPNRSNNVFVGTYVRKAFNTTYFPDQFTVVPKNGDKVTVGDQELIWHALDSANFDVKLFRFAYGLNKQTYGVIFWAVSVINSPRELKNVRMAVGSNSASMWWLNGNDVVDLFDDRRMVMDDVVSKPLTLNKGENIIRGAVINGPGLSDFCVRFIDENGHPVKGITMSLK